MFYKAESFHTENGQGALPDLTRVDDDPDVQKERERLLRARKEFDEAEADYLHCRSLVEGKGGETCTEHDRWEALRDFPALTQRFYEAKLGLDALHGKLEAARAKARQDRLPIIRAAMATVVKKRQKKLDELPELNDAVLAIYAKAEEVFGGFQGVLPPGLSWMPFDTRKGPDSLYERNRKLCQDEKLL